jgi:hypothetical protein
MPEMALAEANRIAFGHIEGWLGPRVWQSLEFIQRHHDRLKIVADIAEIGVHHGQLFFMMASLSRPEERCIAIDLFDDQEKNLDKSGKGSLAKFEGHLNMHFSHLAARVHVLTADSMSFTPSTARAQISRRGVRLFSVDGGHTVEHVVNDLCIAQELLVPSGVVLLDDFLGPHWPSVTEGCFSYMSTANRRLAPFLIFQNKLFLTTFSEQPQMLVALREYLDATVGPEIHSGKWRYVEIFRHKVLSFGGK